MWLWTDDTGCYLDQLYNAIWIGKDVRGSFTTNMKYYEDQNRWYMMMSWPNLRSTLIGTDVEECWHDLNWSVMWIRTGDRGWRHELFWTEILIGTDVKDAVLTKLQCYVDFIVCDRKFHDQFEVIFGLEQMIQNDVLT
jgi:hypothetical protein